VFRVQTHPHDLVANGSFAALLDYDARGMTRPLRLTLLMATACLALPAGAAAASFTAGPMTYVERSAQAAPDAQTAKTAKCPSGTHVTGGGAYTDGPTVDDEVATSAPVDGKDLDKRPDDGWLAEINTGAGAAREIEAYAICAAFGKLQYLSSSTSVGPNDDATTHVACPEGTRPLGGGVATTSASTAVALRRTFPWNRPNSDMFWDGWLGTANNLGAKSRTVTAYVICRSLNDNDYNFTGSFDSVTPLGQSDASSPSCTGDFHATGGGASIDGGLQGEVASTLPEDDSADSDEAPDDAWQGWFNNESGTTDIDRASVQFCVK
jgi:hypothetical protein